MASLILAIIGSDNDLALNSRQAITWTNAGFYTKGRPLVKSNLICPLDKLSWQPGCPVLNINIQSNPVISRAVNSRKSVSRACTLDPKF